MRRRAVLSAPGKRENEISCGGLGTNHPTLSLASESHVAVARAVLNASREVKIDPMPFSFFGQVLGFGMEWIPKGLR